MLKLMTWFSEVLWQVINSIPLPCRRCSYSSEYAIIYEECRSSMRGSCKLVVWAPSHAERDAWVGLEHVSSFGGGNAVKILPFCPELYLVPMNNSGFTASRIFSEWSFDFNVLTLPDENQFCPHGARSTSPVCNRIRLVSKSEMDWWNTEVTHTHYLAYT